MSLLAAIQLGDVEAVAAALAARPEKLDARDRYRRTPLHLAAECGFDEVVAVLLAAGSQSLDSCDFNDKTPLLLAAQAGHLRTVQLLLDAGAKLPTKMLHWRWQRLPALVRPLLRPTHHAAVLDWRVDDFAAKRRLPNGGRVTSAEWLAFDCRWRLLLFADGNPLTRNDEFIALYLEVPDHEELPQGWRREIDFCVSVVNQAGAGENISLEAQVDLNANIVDYGFPRLLAKQALDGFLVDDTLVFQVEISMRTCVFPGLHPSMLHLLVSLLST